MGGGNYSRRSDHEPGVIWSAALIQMLETLSCRARTTMAAKRPVPARMFTNVCAPVSSTFSSRETVSCWVAIGLVGDFSCAVILGRTGAVGVAAIPGRGLVAALRAMVGLPKGVLFVASFVVLLGEIGALAVLKAIVGVGAGFGGAPAVLNAMVGIGFGANGEPVIAGGATGIAAEGTAGGASDALIVTRTVSFFNGTLEVCFDGRLLPRSAELFGLLFEGRIGWDSDSLILVGFKTKKIKARHLLSVKLRSSFS